MGRASGCTHCEHGVWRGACARCKPIHTRRDQLYNFRMIHGVKTPVDIHSKRQFESVCRANRLVPVTRDDVLTRGEPSRPTTGKHRIKPLIQAKAQDLVQQACAQARAIRKAEA